MSRVTRIISVAVVMCLLVTMICAAAKPASASPGIVTQTKHVRLGCRMDMPFSKSIHDETWVLGSYVAGLTMDFNGVIHLEMDMGADITFSYDPAKVVPGGILPVSITYMPTNDSGPELSFSVVGDLHAQAWGLWAIPLFDYYWPSVTFVQASGDFVAPLDGEIPLALVPLSGSKMWIKEPVFGINVVSLQLGGLLQLPAVPSGSVSGLGGAAAAMFVTGGLPTGDLLTRPILEWQHPGETKVVNIQVVNPQNVGITLSPVTHWVGTWVDATIYVDVFDVLSALFGGGIPVPIMSGDLGPDFIKAGLPEALKGTFGEQLLGRISNGLIPVPLLNPEISMIPPITIGSVGASFEMGLPCDVQAGDIVFGRSGPSLYGYWGHSGMVLNDAPAGTLLSQVNIVEATSNGQGDPLPGVRVSNLKEFWNGRKAVAFKRLGSDSWQWWNKQNERNAVINAAMTYAVGKKGVPYDWKFNKFNEDAQYCSELIWHAYQLGPPQSGLQGINLDSGRGLTVFPDDIFRSQKLDLVNYWHILGEITFPDSQ
jgi:hypothetical protein